jgi:hypothetical protein
MSGRRQDLARVNIDKGEEMVMWKRAGKDDENGNGTCASRWKRMGCCLRYMASFALVGHRSGEDSNSL